MNLTLRNETDTLAAGARLFRSIDRSGLIFLSGELGAGKTTLVRGFLRAQGYLGAVKSPTFSLVEEYQFRTWRLVHFDLYRLADPEELEWMGIRDYFAEPCICFVEWPERGRGMLPGPDLHISLSMGQNVRQLCLDPRTDKGYQLVRDVN